MKRSPSSSPPLDASARVTNGSTEATNSNEEIKPDLGAMRISSAPKTPTKNKNKKTATGDSDSGTTQTSPSKSPSKKSKMKNHPGGATPTASGTNGVWDGEKKALFMDEIIAVGYKAADLDLIAGKLGLSKRQLIDQLVPNRSNLRSKAVKGARGEST
ncbi:hypothetical protein I317_07419 [Kwoniella heveanensis CBS 569]|nr:hypothetical protein I317_07419 [Kwoniella heveanensis CBS 569]